MIRSFTPLPLRASSSKYKPVHGEWLFRLQLAVQIARGNGSANSNPQGRQPGSKRSALVLAIPISILLKLPNINDLAPAALWASRRRRERQHCRKILEPHEF